MSDVTPVEWVSNFLSAAQYSRLPRPFAIAGMEFDFPAAFIGPEMSLDLVLVADTAFEAEQRIQQRVEGIARALDVVGSKRPLTIVLVGPRPHESSIEAMSRVCRVLPIGNTSDDFKAAVENWLAVLLPLSLPGSASPVSGEQSQFVSESVDAVSAQLIDASLLGVDEVMRRLDALVSEPLDNLSMGNN